MIWNGWDDFWNMGGYGLYVWGSYALCAVVFTCEPLWSKRKLKSALSKIRDAA